MPIDYHVHALAHGEYQYSPAWIRRFLTRAKDMKISQLGFSDHDWFVSQIDIPLINQVASEPDFRELMVRAGIEVDYKPDRETEIRSLLMEKPYDFVIGSVHHLGDWPFDHPDHKDGFLRRELEEIYREYYALVRKLVRSKLFDIVGHIDLIKVWGLKPPSHREALFLDPLLSELKASGMAVEVNTGGLRKPVGEIYPSEILMRTLFAWDIPITFGSDAHHPDDLGHELGAAFKQAWAAGYRTMTGFSGRKKIFYPITHSS